LAQTRAVSHAQPQAAPASAPVPVARPRLPTAEAILPYLQQIDDARWYSNFGPLLTKLEQRLADRFARPTQVITVANATQALTLALQAMDLPPGGYVAMPAWTFVATAHAVVQAGMAT
jgi:dTDP-4-amino-4,6-dideoxygalactose transaminase